jgi:hypothetical protein
MIFLRAFGLTRFTASQQTRNSGASCAQRRTSTRFPQAKVKVSCIRGNCHCPAWRLLIGVWYARVHPHARQCPFNRRARANASKRTTRTSWLVLSSRSDIRVIVPVAPLILMKHLLLLAFHRSANTQPNSRRGVGCTHRPSSTTTLPAAGRRKQRMTR